MRVISVLSSKGGVGKTFLVTNLAYQLANLGYEVVAVDANFTTPHLASHLGFYLVPNTLHKVLKDQIELKRAIYQHELGFKVIPGSLSLEDLTDLRIEKFDEIIKGLSADFVLIDCAPGLGREAMIGLRAGEEVLIVTLPEFPALTDALKTLRIARGLEKIILGAVVNRVKKKEFFNKSDIEKFLGTQILAIIPEDENVATSLYLKAPFVFLNPKSLASLEIEKLSYRIAGLPFFKRKISFLERIRSWFSR